MNPDMIYTSLVVLAVLAALVYNALIFPRTYPLRSPAPHPTGEHKADESKH